MTPDSSNPTPSPPPNPVSQTAFYCSGARAWDAQRWRPICRDDLASRFMSPTAQEFFRPYQKLYGTNVICAARHRIIDDLVRAQLKQSPETLIVLLGAGFDTRAFRLPSGRYLEIDEAPLMDYKETCLPAGSAKNPLTRLAIDFAKESLADKLTPYQTTGAVVVIVEGVTMYLSQSALQSLAQTIRQVFPQAKVIADMMSETYGQKYGNPIRQKLATVDAVFQFSEPPEEIFQAHGFQSQQRLSIFKQTLILSFPGVPHFCWPLIWRTTPRLLRDGYLINLLAPTNSVGP